MLVSWMENASCKETDPEDFFDNYLESEEVAIKVHSICKSCRVKKQCLNYGIQMRCMGIWGGKWLQNGKIIQKKEMIVDDYFWRIDARY